MEHDFNGHEFYGIHGVNGKKRYCRAFYLVNKLHDLSGNFSYDDFFRKTHARLYLLPAYAGRAYGSPENAALGLQVQKNSQHHPTILLVI